MPRRRESPLFLGPPGVEAKLTGSPTGGVAGTGGGTAGRGIAGTGGGISDLGGREQGSTSPTATQDASRTGPRGLQDEKRRSDPAQGLVGSMLAAMSRSRAAQRQQPSGRTSAQTPRIEPQGFPLVGSAGLAAAPRASAGLITGEPGVSLSGLDPAQAGAGLTGGGLGLPGGEAGVGTDAFRKMLLEILSKRA